jgi:hypothetical protein
VCSVLEVNLMHERDLPGVAILGLSFAALACTVTDGGSEKADPCQDTAVPIAWTDSTDMGTPADRFCGYSGTCTAELSWDGSGGDGVATVAPTQGRTTVRTTVELQPSTARGCASALQVDAWVTLEIGGTMIAKQRPVLLTVAGRQTSSISFAVKVEDLQSWISVQSASPAQTLEASVDIAPLTSACAGGIAIRASGQGSGPMVPLGPWFGAPAPACPSRSTSSGGDLGGGFPQT